ATASRPKRLSRQPGGLEAFGRVVIVPAPDPPRVLQLLDLAKVQFDWHTASLSGCRLAEQRDDSVITGIDQPLQFNRPILEVLCPGAQELDEPIAPAIPRRPRKAGKHDPLCICSDGF